MSNERLRAAAPPPSYHSTLSHSCHDPLRAPRFPTFASTRAQISASTPNSPAASRAHKDSNANTLPRSQRHAHFQTAESLNVEILPASSISIPATISPVPIRTPAGTYFIPNTPLVYMEPRTMLSPAPPAAPDETDSDSSDCSGCCDSPSFKQTVRVILLGQLMSLCLCGTGVGSELLARRGFNAPAAQNFFNYFLLFVVYGAMIAWRSGDRNLLNVLRRRGWKYGLLALIDVQANYLIVYAYQFTNLTSVQILDCSTIPVVMFLSWLFLSVRYLFSHLIGVVICLVGIGLVIYADATSGRGADGGKDRVLGDLLCLGAALLYGVANVTEEFLVKQYDRFEYLGLVGMFGCVIAGAQFLIFEHASLIAFPWSWNAFAEYSLYTGAMFTFYSLVSLVMQQSSALMFNLSVLTADFYSLLAGILIFSYNFNFLYFVSFVVVIVGSVVYALKPTEETSRSEATWAARIFCVCCPCALCMDCRPRPNFTVREAQRSPSISEDTANELTNSHSSSS